MASSKAPHALCNPGGPGAHRHSFLESMQVFCEGESALVPARWLFGERRFQHGDVIPSKGRVEALRREGSLDQDLSIESFLGRSSKERSMNDR